MACQRFLTPMSRREALRACAAGFGSVALAGMAGVAHATPSVYPAHFMPRARRVIFLFMWGGASHVDLFDPKPRLNLDAGKPLRGADVGQGGNELGTLLGSPFAFRQHGQSGMWMSELTPHLARHADKLCMIRSLHTEGSAHGEALLRLHTGNANLVRPSVGAWVSYGLGSDSEDIPAFVTISPPRGHGGVQNYGSAFLPARHQGTAIGSAEIPIAQSKIPNLESSRMDRSLQRRQLDLIQSFNQGHLEATAGDSQVDGLIASYELAFRMQSTIPSILGMKGETQATLDAYGVDQDPTDNFARQCLLARQFAEAGARYIQVSTDYTWDHHNKVKEGLIAETAKTDQPIAALLDDLEQRGMLEDTLVLWGGEFGRTPMAENGDGRNHHPQALTVWMAGGGVKPGLTYGATDDFGYRPVQDPMHMHDLHATLLHLLGLDHTKLTYQHAGRDFRLTDVFGNVAQGILA